jgi:hypothetical protein
MSFPLRRLVPVCLPVLMLPLFGCGPGRNEFPPVCPEARLVPSLADVTRYAGSGGGHDVTDMILQARVLKVDGKCQSSDDKALLPTTVQIGIGILRGPAMRGREADVPVFIAVTEGDDVLDKRIFPVHVAFPPNVDSVTMSSPEITLALPVSKTKTGAAYRIIAGFQLTPDELVANQHADPLR